MKEKITNIGKKGIFLGIFFLLSTETGSYFLNAQKPHSLPVLGMIFNQAVATEAVNPHPKIKPSADDQSTIEQLKSAKTQEEEERILDGASRFVKRLYSYANAGMDYFEFYGRVVDQFDQPVEGVRIQTHVGGGHAGGGFGYAPVITDKGGYFEINKKGGSLQIRSMSKAGYEIYYLKQTSVFTFTPHKIDQHHGDLDNYQTRENAYVYQAWKIMPEDKKANLHNYQGRFGLMGDDRVYTFNLLNSKGSIKKEGVSEGQLAIQFFRSNQEKKAIQSDWSLLLTIKNGGLTEVNDIYMNRVPESGYVSSIEITRDKQKLENEQTSFFRKHYYFKSGGLQGRLSLIFNPYMPKGKKYDGIVTLNYSINKNGKPYLSSFKGFDSLL